MMKSYTIIKAPRREISYLVDDINTLSNLTSTMTIGSNVTNDTTMTIGSNDTNDMDLEQYK